MFFMIVYGLGGLYLMLMSFGLLHRVYMAGWNGPRRTALRITATGLLILAFYYAWFAWYMNTEEGKQLQDLQRKMQQQYFHEQR